jgi:hypothetical protein
VVLLPLLVDDEPESLDKFYFYYIDTLLTLKIKRFLYLNAIFSGFSRYLLVLFLVVDVVLVLGAVEVVLVLGIVEVVDGQLSVNLKREIFGTV